MVGSCEIFGPLLPIITVSSHHEAYEFINDERYKFKLISNILKGLASCSVYLFQ